MAYLPEPFQDFQRSLPEVSRTYEALVTRTEEAGPLDERTRRLVKLGIAVGARLEGSVKSQVRRAKEMGLSDAEIDHAIILALSSIGLPSMVAARTWAQDVLAHAGKKE
jgi:4-carboxymuconolactone decarboxylase